MDFLKHSWWHVLAILEHSMHRNIIIEYFHADCVHPAISTGLIRAEC